jgi:hypothetical protein
MGVLSKARVLSANTIAKSITGQRSGVKEGILILIPIYNSIITAAGKAERNSPAHL